MPYSASSSRVNAAASLRLRVYVPTTTGRWPLVEQASKAVIEGGCPTMVTMASKRTMKLELRGRNAPLAAIRMKHEIAYSSVYGLTVGGAHDPSPADSAFGVFAQHCNFLLPCRRKFRLRQPREDRHDAETLTHTRARGGRSDDHGEGKQHDHPQVGWKLPVDRDSSHPRHA